MKVKMVLLAIVVSLLCVPLAQAGPYVGFQIGPNFSTGDNAQVYGYQLSRQPSFSTGIMVGTQLGFDFNDQRYNFPKWARYFGAALDYQFNTMNLNSQTYSTPVVFQYRGNSRNAVVSYTTGSVNGNQNSMGFLGYFKYPTMVSKEYPQGRLFPFVGVGPTVTWTRIGDWSATNVGVLVEPGVRYMFTPNIAGEVAYRFRYVHISNGNASFDNNNHSAVVRVAYYF